MTNKEAANKLKRENISVNAIYSFKEDAEALDMAIKALQIWDNIQKAYENLIVNGETKGSSDYWQGVEDMWKIVQKEIKL